MARESNHSRLGRYQREVDRARDFRQSEDYDDLWTRMRDLYRGKHYNSGDNDGKTKKLIVNMAFATKNVISPSVAVNNPRFTIMARKPETAPHAVITQEILNYLWRTHKFQRQFRLAVDDMLIFGHGWIKVGYKFAKQPVEKPVAETSESSAPDDDSEVEMPGVEDREGKDGQVETEQRVVDNRPFIERVSPFNIYVDPDAHNLEEARWIAQRVRRAVNDVKVDPRYDAKARKAVSASAWKDQSSGDDDIHEQDNKIAYADVIEFYDIKAGKFCTFAAHQEIDVDAGEQRQFLIAPKEMPYSFGHPFVMLRDYDVPDYFYPMGELEQIESLQYELNETRSDMLNNRKRDVRKYLIDDSRFDQRGKNALQSDVDNTIVPVLGGDDPKSAIAPMPGVGITADAYNMSEIIQNDMDAVSATSDYMRGGQTEIRRTATESAMIQDAQNSRAADKLAQIEGALAEIGSRVVQLMQQFLTGKHVARVVGAQAVPIWINYDKDYIKGEFDFEVEGGSTQPRNESFRRQSAMQFLDVMAPLMQSGVVDPTAVARKILRDFGEKDADSFLLQQMPMPGAEMGGVPAGGPPPMAPPDQGQNGLVSAPEESPAGLPPELLAQLTGQVGLPQA